MTKIICSIFSLDAKIGVNVLKGEILKVTKLEGYTGSLKEVILKKSEGGAPAAPPSPNRVKSEWYF